MTALFEPARSISMERWKARTSDRMPYRPSVADNRFARQVGSIERLTRRLGSIVLVQLRRWHSDAADQARFRDLANEPEVLNDVGLSWADALPQSLRRQT